MQEIELNNSIPWTMERYNNLFRNISDAMTINDSRGNILDVNRQCLDLFGYSRDEMLKLNITDLHSPEVLKEIGDNNEKFTQDGFIFLETKFMKKNGEIFTGEVRATRFKIDGHEVIQGLIRDISDKIIAEKRLKESERRFRSLFEQSIDAIIIHEKGKIKQVNASACKILGYSKDQLQSMTIYESPYIPYGFRLQYNNGKHLCGKNA